jgi:uncharacterized protein YjiK
VTDFVALLSDGSAFVLDFNSNVIGSLENVSSLSWSRKGKQLGCGMRDGSISQVNLSGQVVKTIPLLEEFESVHVQELLWIETKVFVCVYSSSDGRTDICAVTSDDKPSYQMYDPVAVFGEAERKPKYYMLPLFSEYIY